MDLSSTQWILLLLAAWCVGAAKAGFAGVGLIPVFVMAEIFGKSSVGILLPMLVVADISVFHGYRKYGSWKPVWKLLPPALVGIALGVFILRDLPEEWARPVIGGLILFMVLLLVFRRIDAEKFSRLAHSAGFGQAAGVLAGVATMLANAAGPVFQLYFISRDIPKMELIGIGARFFLLVNILKLPLTGGLGYTDPESLLLNLKLVPLILIGVWSGKKLLQMVSQRVFEWMVIGVAVVAGLRLLSPLWTG